MHITVLENLMFLIVFTQLNNGYLHYRRGAEGGETGEIPHPRVLG